MKPSMQQLYSVILPGEVDALALAAWRGAGSSRAWGWPPIAADGQNIDGYSLTLKPDLR